MPSKNRSLKSCKLYLILDRAVCDYGRLLTVAKEAAVGGVDLVQLRDKNGSAKEILDFSFRLKKILKNKIPFIVNDRADLAILSGSSGVHVGQDDFSVRDARKLIGPGKIVGASCQTLAQAVAAEKAGADYIGFGSVFKTKTKPDRDPMDLSLLAQIYKRIKIPVFAIGGIDLSNVRRLTAIGVNRIAVCRVFCESQKIKETASEFLNILNCN